MKRRKSITATILLLTLIISLSPIALTASSLTPPADVSKWSPWTGWEDDPSTWAIEQVAEAIQEQLVPNILQREYVRPITRAEFATLAVYLYERVKDREITERMDFNDTTNVNVRKMGALGVVTGVGDGHFDPHGRLTREQAAVMLARLAEVMGNPLTESDVAFADNAKISYWAADAVGQVQNAGIMSGTGNNMFSPRGEYTREQSIVTILRLFEMVKTDFDFSGQRITDARLAEMVASGEIPPNVTRLNLAWNQITDISPLRNMSDLVALDLVGNQLDDISPLRRLTNLTILNVGGDGLSDITVLRYFTNLTELGLSNVDVENLSPISGLTNLTMLNIWGTQGNLDISAISQLTNLTSLMLLSVETDDFTPVGNLMNLEQIILGNAYHLRNISFLSNLAKTETLLISGGVNIEDYTPIGSLSGLVVLSIDGSKIIDSTVLPLDRLTNLQVLSLANNQIISLPMLGDLPNLDWLDLSNNGISDINKLPLESLKNLFGLTLTGNRISDISPLGELTNLRQLCVRNNRITDISPLGSLYSLQWLGLCGNPINQRQISELSLALPDCQIDFLW